MAQPLNQQKEPSILQFWDSDKTLIKEVSKSEEVGTTFGYSTKKKGIKIVGNAFGLQPKKK